MSFTFQIIGGIGNGLTTTSALAIISSYKEDRQKFISYFEVISGLGTLMGPIIGSGFYMIGGYEAPFFGIGFIYTCVLIAGICIGTESNEEVVQHEEMVSSIQDKLDNLESSFIDSKGPKHQVSMC